MANLGRVCFAPVSMAYKFVSFVTGSLLEDIVGMSSTISRRVLLGAGLGAAATSVWASGTKTRTVDVVIIGAGAAGIGAARALSDAGISYVVLEASPRVGGRAITDTQTFGVPFDLGAHWLHYATTNPFVEFAKSYGYEVYPAPNAEALYVDGRRASNSEMQAYRASYQTAYKAISDAGRSGQDVTPARVVDSKDPWAGLTHFVIGPWEMGKDFDQFSCKDWWHSDDGPDWFCRQGYGTVVARRADGLMIRRNTSVNEVRWGPRGVRVRTTRGDLKAAMAIVTPSTGVLNAGQIRFSPPLPERTMQALAGVPMGLYNHIAMQFDTNVLGAAADTYVLHKPRTNAHGSPEAMGVLANVSGTLLSIGDVGGKFALELEREGTQAARDFAIATLQEIFGEKIDKHLLKTRVTSWGKNPLTLGSYASASPGQFAAREILREPIGERIWLAGEACSQTRWATVAGAYEYGTLVAEKIAAIVLDEAA